MMIKYCAARTSSQVRSIQRTKVLLQHLCKMSSSAEDEVFFEQINTAGLITLNRPKALNALNLPMVRKIYPQLKAWNEDPGVSHVVIKGAGDKAFCAGGDIVKVTKVKGEIGENFFKEEYILNNAIGTLSKPYIALTHGITMGGGAGLSVHGHYRVATEKTLFAMPETGIGLFPDVGGGYFLPRLSGQLGMYLALTGYRLKGRDAHKAGVSTHFVEFAKLPLLENALLNLKDPRPHDVAEVLGKYQQESPLDADKEFSLTPHLRDIDNIFAGETVEEIFQNCERDGSPWALKQLETMKKMSPTSMKITFRQLRLGATMTLQQCLNIDYRLSQRCMEDNDFIEGVRSLLIDKDNNPQWKPATLEGVTDEKVDYYFSPLPQDRELIL